MKCRHCLAKYLSPKVSTLRAYGFPPDRNSKKKNWILLDWFIFSCSIVLLSTYYVLKTTVGTGASRVDEIDVLYPQEIDMVLLRDKVTNK